MFLNMASRWLVRLNFATGFWWRMVDSLSRLL